MGDDDELFLREEMHHDDDLHPIRRLKSRKRQRKMGNNPNFAGSRQMGKTQASEAEDPSTCSSTERGSPAS
jgi:hypothetical protein